jgi:hypothetical protein
MQWDIFVLSESSNEAIQTADSHSPIFIQIIEL